MAMDSSKFEAIKNKARKMIHEDAQKDRRDEHLRSGGSDRNASGQGLCARGL